MIEIQVLYMGDHFTQERCPGMPIKTIATGFKIFLVLLLGLIGGAVGAILIGQFSSLWFSVIGSLIGFVFGAILALCLILLNRYISWWEWFTV